MKKILIALNDAVVLSMLKRQRAVPTELELFFAKDGRQTLEIIDSEAVDLLITSLNLPDTDVLELVSTLAEPHPNLKLAFFLPDENASLNRLTSVYWTLKPNLLQETVHFLHQINVIEYQALPFAKIRLADFLQLIEYQNKTCLLAVENSQTGQSGLIYFKYGILFDAFCGERSAKAAVLEMLNWPQVLFSFKPFDEDDIHKQIAESLDQLIDSITPPAMPPEKLNEEVETIELLQEAREEVSAAPAIEQLATPVLELEHKLTAQPEDTAKRQATVVLAAKQRAEREAEAKAKAEAELAATQKAEREAKAKAEAEAKLKAEIEAKAKARAQAIAKAKALSQQINQLDLSSFLKSLQEMNHYMACAVFDLTTGIVIKYDVSAADNSTASEQLVLLIKIALEASRKTAAKSELFQLYCEQAIFMTVFEAQHQLAIAVLLEPNASNIVGLAKMKLTKIADSLREQLACSIQA